MREIKFRYWDGEKILDWHAIKNVCNGMSFLNNNSNVMQYTGFKDQDGKEIYDGDRLKTKDGLVFEIKNNVKSQDGEIIGYDISVDWSECKVCGNKFENKNKK